MWVIVGLGNPGPAYAETRHNIGFMVTEVIATRWNIALESRPDARIGRGRVADRPAILVQPQTFMNRSGEVVASLEPDTARGVIAVYDDLDLPTGSLRVRARGGSGGHRGVASLVQQLGSDFTRVRVGIGRPPVATSVSDYVLGLPTESEARALRTAAAAAADAIECIVADGVTAAMNRFNGQVADDVVTISKE